MASGGGGGGQDPGLVRLIAKGMKGRDRGNPRLSPFGGPLNLGMTLGGLDPEPSRSIAAEQPNPASDVPIESEEGPVGTLMGVGGGVMMGKELLKGMVGTGGKMLGKAIAKRAAQKEAASVAPLGPMPPPGPHRVQVAKPVWDDNSMPAMEPINSAGDSLPAFSGSMPPAAPDLSSFPGRSGMDPLGYMDRRDLAQMAPGGIRQASAAPASESDAIRRQFNLGPDQSVAPANRSAWDTQVPISHELGPDGRGPRMPNNPNGWEESPNSTPPYNPNTHTTLPGLSDYRQAVPPRRTVNMRGGAPAPAAPDPALREEARILRENYLPAEDSPKFANNGMRTELPPFARNRDDHLPGLDDTSPSWSRYMDRDHMLDKIDERNLEQAYPGKGVLEKTQWRMSRDMQPQGDNPSEWMTQPPAPVEYGDPARMSTAFQKKYMKPTAQWDTIPGMAPNDKEAFSKALKNKALIGFTPQFKPK